jgi:hypothetical protein
MHVSGLRPRFAPFARNRRLHPGYNEAAMTITRQGSSLDCQAMSSLVAAAN